MTVNYCNFGSNPRPGYYIPDPMGYQGPGDAYGPHPFSSFGMTPPGSGQPDYQQPWVIPGSPSQFPINQGYSQGYPQQQVGYAPQQTYQPQQTANYAALPGFNFGAPQNTGFNNFLAPFGFQQPQQMQQPGFFYSNTTFIA